MPKPPNPPNPPRPRRRPKAPKPYVPFSQEVADRILQGLSEGRGLRALCRGPHMPTRPTVMRWLKAHPVFADEVFLARFLGGLDRPGRPTRLTPELLDAIYLRLCHGEPLRTLCADPAMPARATVQAWAAARPDAAEALAHGREIARQQAAERLFDASGWGPWVRARWAAEAQGRPPPDTPPPGDADASPPRNPARQDAPPQGELSRSD